MLQRMNSPNQFPNHVRRNRQIWDQWSTRYAAPGRRAWNQNDITWGVWHIPESDIRVLPELPGQRVLELGCGTAYFSAWLARQGAHVVGLDNSFAQLQTARTLQREHNLHFPLIHADAEQSPFPDATFDLILSEYGASIWCDPYRWIPEASRLLRPGGHLVFLRNSTIQMLCTPDPSVAAAAQPQLHRDYFDLYRIEWPDDHSIEFALPYGKWIALFRQCNFLIESLTELQAPSNASTPHTHVTAEWSQRWPSEEIWRLRKQPNSP